MKKTFTTILLAFSLLISQGVSADYLSRMRVAEGQLTQAKSNRFLSMEQGMLCGFLLISIGFSALLTKETVKAPHLEWDSILAAQLLNPIISFFIGVTIGIPISEFNNLFHRKFTSSGQKLWIRLRHLRGMIELVEEGQEYALNEEFGTTSLTTNPDVEKLRQLQEVYSNDLIFWLARKIRSDPLDEVKRRVFASAPVVEDEDLFRLLLVWNADGDSSLPLPFDPMDDFVNFAIAQIRSGQW